MNPSACAAPGRGLYNLGTATLTKSTITGNKAKGGPAGPGGIAGTGMGGGVYNLATISIDDPTTVFGNQPDDWYGW